MRVIVLSMNYFVLSAATKRIKKDNKEEEEVEEKESNILIQRIKVNEMRNEANQKLKIQFSSFFIRSTGYSKKAFEMSVFKLKYNFFFISIFFFSRWSQHSGDQIMISESLMMCPIILAVEFSSGVSKINFLCSSVLTNNKKPARKFSWK